jgi:putative selenate reductase
MDDMGYGYVAFGDFHFKDDLQYADAIPMLERLQALADSKNLTFGVKLTNTCPVDIKAGELPGQEMYMSGKSLYMLSMSVAEKLSKSFQGKLRISYSGGADFFNIQDIVGAGIWPVTVATTLLKPGGYQRLGQFAQLFATQPAAAFTGIDVAKVSAMVGAGTQNAHYTKAKKPLPSRKINKPVPLTDCFIAPCEEGCPIHQDITAYGQLVEEGRYEEALRVIISKNPLPFITGTICYHKCMNKCTRNFYESAVNIRKNKLIAAEGGYAAVMDKPPQAAVSTGKKAVIVGGGPAGLAAAYFLSLGGIEATVIEKEDKMGGAVRYIIPAKQISPEAIDKDVQLIAATGVKMVNNKTVTDFAALRKEYDYVVLAIGAVGAGFMKKKGAADKPVPGAFYEAIGVAVNEKGRPQVDSKTMQTSLDHVYAVGDGLAGIASVVESIRDGSLAAAHILGHAVAADQFIKANEESVYDRRGNLAEEGDYKADSSRCLNCDSICEACVEVCPNRANISLTVPGMAKHQVIHVDYMCNECGNCRSFCPWDSAPYQDKFTLFANEADMADSKNQGFVVIDKAAGRCKVRLQGSTTEYTVGTEAAIPADIRKIIDTVLADYTYLLI